MSQNSAIGWTKHTFNAWWGCTEAGPECDNCYAREISASPKFGGLKLWGADAPRRFFGDAHWRDPLKWDRAAAKAGERHHVFTNSMADVLEDRRDLDDHRARLWQLIADTPNLIWLLLTKRPSKFRTLVPPAWHERWPENVWPGTTAGTQKTANVLVPQLVASTPYGAVRFVSGEPLLEHVNYPYLGIAGGISWLILGGESHRSKKKARPCEVSWIRSGVEQCRATGAAVFVKQLGSQAYGTCCDAGLGGAFHNNALHPIKLRAPKGADPSEWPEDLRVQEYPRWGIAA